MRLEIGDISRRLLANISDVHADLLEIASYVYAADSAIQRGGLTDEKLGAQWRRTLRFAIPVRMPSVIGPIGSSERGIIDAFYPRRRRAGMGLGRRQTQHHHRCVEASGFCGKFPHQGKSSSLHKKSEMSSTQRLIALTFHRPPAVHRHLRRRGVDCTG